MDNLPVLTEKVRHHLAVIYKGVNIDDSLENVCAELLVRMRISHEHDILQPTPHTNLWNENDVVLITYGDSIIEPSDELSKGMQKPPLQTLHHFLHKYCAHAVNHVHILPFSLIALTMDFRLLIIQP